MTVKGDFINKWVPRQEFLEGYDRIFGKKEGGLMTPEDAYKALIDAESLINNAYKILLRVEKECPNPSGFLKLKDVIVDIGAAELTLRLMQDEYAEMGRGT